MAPCVAPLYPRAIHKSPCNCGTLFVHSIGFFYALRKKIMSGNYPIHHNFPEVYTERDPLSRPLLGAHRHHPSPFTNAVFVFSCLFFTTVSNALIPFGQHRSSAAIVTKRLPLPCRAVAVFVQSQFFSYLAFSVVTIPHSTPSYRLPKTNPIRICFRYPSGREIRCVLRKRPTNKRILGLIAPNITATMAT